MSVRTRGENKAFLENVGYFIKKFSSEETS